MRWVRRLLIALHIVKPRNARCKRCGWLVPHIGTKETRSLMAWDHWVALHENEGGDTE